MSGSVFATVALCSVLVLGCAPGRMADFKDSGRLAIGFGFGLSADAKLGDLTHPALGIVSSAAMVGFDTRDIEGQWYEARVSDPYATYWYRREQKSWGYSLNSSGWRGAWESLDWFDALEELDEPIDQEGMPETGTLVGGEILSQEITIGRWLPVRVGADDTGPIWTFRTATDVKLGVHALLLGARVGFNLLEFVDFLLGMAGYDIAGDDPAPTSP
jgi:hypothetical protein